MSDELKKLLSEIADELLLLRYVNNGKEPIELRRKILKYFDKHR